MRFVVEAPAEVGETALVYRAADYAFATEPRPAGADTSILVNDVELMVDGNTNQVLYLTGYCPYQSWQATDLVAPRAPRGALFVRGVDLPPGISTRLSPREVRWATRVNAATGWVCISSPDAESSIERDGVEFAPGCVAVIHEERLLALWLHPRELPAGVQPSGT
jgi:hypothetical protein